jgi:hypothetical protein
MILAELEIWHSRPITPTRRVSLGHLMLPADPAPGFGGILLGAVVARHLFVQPRLRHRFQTDRHGLALSRHQLIAVENSAEFAFADGGSPLQQVLGSIYALERLDAETRRALGPMMRRAMTWRGPFGASFIAYLAGSNASSISAISDPRAWALEILSFPPGTLKPSKKEVTSRFREMLRNVHPDHGASERDASRAIADLSEARRILSQQS